MIMMMKNSHFMLGSSMLCVVLLCDQVSNEKQKEFENV